MERSHAWEIVGVSGSPESARLVLKQFRGRPIIGA